MVAIKVMKATVQNFQAIAAGGANGHATGISQSCTGQHNADHHRHRTSHNRRQDTIKRSFSDTHDKQTNRDLKYSGHNNTDLYDSHTIGTIELQLDH